MGFYDELKTLMDEVANWIDRWSGPAGWTFEPGSSASAEVANTEVRLDSSPWGERPVRSAYQYAQMETKLTVELSRCAALLIGVARPAPGIETVTRASAFSALMRSRRSSRSVRPRGCAAGGAVDAGVGVPDARLQAGANPADHSA